ncbi:hypothetical protein H1S01_05695 [Heliobacterium chlorum]|uniref:Peptide O-xylosyltransferase n=1 Tax=Heliobacterium chlorum TaxID=2698 RepID=A0ABR7SZN4_HELCL|nr:beta-1,6-N-acetylglucosaminyltransferase [Heliobacterium chlorum]MBC9784004.1 hypothetical protein [Heliobacterium chlorum]
MKQAVLIMAHKNLNQVIRLIRSLSKSDFHFLVHLDSKMDVTDSEFCNLLNCSDNVFIVKKRISGVLDTWSLVEISLSLIELAKQIELNKNIHYSYYLLLSGQDYPIKSVEYITEFLGKTYPKPLIDCTPYDKHNWLYYKFNVIGIREISKYVDSKLNRGILRKIIKLPLIIYGSLLGWVYRNFLYDYKLYGGSAWWILPDKVIEFILHEIKTNGHKINKLKITNTPEETFFQIMTMASPLSNLVDLNPKDMVEQNCMTYAHFSDEGKPFMGHPYILTKEDFSKIVKLPQLFARKFDTVTDSNILDMIDRHIVNNT